LPKNVDKINRAIRARARIIRTIFTISTILNTPLTTKGTYLDDYNFLSMSERQMMLTALTRLNVDGLALIGHHPSSRRAAPGPYKHSVASFLIFLSSIARVYVQKE
jgi:hypothetical protein